MTTGGPPPGGDDARGSACTRPLIALTLGDVAGIGPEISVRSAVDPDVTARVDTVLVGRSEIVARELQRCGIGADLEVITSLDALRAAAAARPAGRLLLWEIGDRSAADVVPGHIDPRAGRAAYDALIAATDAALAHQIDGVVTAPLHKEALRLAGIPHPGHTEILAARCGAASHAMMLHLPQGGMIRPPHGLSIAHVTLHTSIASVPKLLTVDRVRDTIQLLHGFLLRMGISSPRIGVCALNPHGGEHGLFGDEEARVIEPAVSAEVQRGIDCRGPLPADTLVRAAIVDAAYDGLVAMYHEQGHIPIKLIGFDRAVNITLGLPIIRTSPSHGTAFDIAGKGIARWEGMKGAILAAARLVAAPGGMASR